MKLNQIKTVYPQLTKRDLSFIKKEVGDKCNEFYFLEFMRITRGNVKDAYDLFKFDESLRSILLRYVLRFETQIKSDFVDFICKETNDIKFWCNEKYYILNEQNIFSKIKQKIIDSFKNLNISSFNANSYAAAYVMSFGTFISVFRYINPKFKRKFIDRYLKSYPNKCFKLLLKYLYCIRALRNRCAHATYIVSNSFANQLKQYSFVAKEEYLKSGKEHFSIFELTLDFLFSTLHCNKECKRELLTLLKKYENIYKKYPGRQLINPTIIKKIFN